MGEILTQRSVRVLIRGRVQGVWFRAWTAELAVELGLKGWVRNRRDGAVEALFAGSADAVEAVLAACKDGPPSADVDGIERFEVSPEEAAGLVGFTTEDTV